MTPPQVFLSAALCMALGACRPALASFVPTLQLGITLREVHAEAVSERRDGARHKLASTLFVRLSFSPRTDVAALPTPGETSGLAFLTPCNEADLTCLEEAAEAERELYALQKEIP